MGNLSLASLVNDEISRRNKEKNERRDNIREEEKKRKKIKINFIIKKKK